MVVCWVYDEDRFDTSPPLQELAKDRPWFQHLCSKTLGWIDMRSVLVFCKSILHNSINPEKFPSLPQL